MATSAPVEVSFFPNYEAEQQSKYLVSPLDIRDIEQINLHVRANLIRAARLALEGCTNEVEAEVVLDSAMRQAAQMSLLGGGYYFASIDGSSLVLWRSLTKQQPTVTLDDCALIISDERNSEEIKLALQIIRRKPRKRETPKNPTDIPVSEINNQQ